MPRTWVSLTADELQILSEMAEENCRTPRQELNLAVKQAVKRWQAARARRAPAGPEPPQEAHAA